MLWMATLEDVYMRPTGLGIGIPIGWAEEKALQPEAPAVQPEDEASPQVL
jgi:hypothetical protein